MKKLFCILMTSFAMVCNAADITFMFTDPPGGGAERVVNAMLPTLERSGLTVEKQFFKSCVDAANEMRPDKTTKILILSPGAVNWSNTSEGGKCAPISRWAYTPKLYTTLVSGSLFVCTVPNYQPGKKIRIGYTVSVEQTNLVNRYIANQTGDYVGLPYPGIGPLRTAITAGDVDMFFATSLANEMIAKGGTCIAATAKDNTKKLPFVGNMPEYITAISAVVVNDVPVKVNTSIVSALQSPEFNSEIAKMEYKHKGIGANVPVSEQLKSLIYLETSFK